jgi:hypothetical protein
MDFEETEVRNKCAGEGQQQFNRRTEKDKEYAVAQREKKL